MKFIATLLSLSAVLAVASASGYGGSSGGAASIPAPPCPKNYLFSCQPNLAPAPCAPAAAGGGAGGYGSAGAYSENVPTIVNSPYGYQGLPLNVQHFPNVYGQNFGTY